jgi:hypothetical protein
MEVVESMLGYGEGKSATWEEARAGFEPAQLVRGERTLAVEYRQDGNRWTATSPDLDGFEVSASTLPHLKTAARAVLDGWLDPAVLVDEVEIHEARPPVTQTAGRRAKTSRRRTPRDHGSPQSQAARGAKLSREIRAWAKQQGIVVSERGRIPAHVLEQYQAAERDADTTSERRPARSRRESSRS